MEDRDELLKLAIEELTKHMDLDEALQVILDMNNVELKKIIEKFKKYGTMG